MFDPYPMLGIIIPHPLNFRRTRESIPFGRLHEGCNEDSQAQGSGRYRRWRAQAWDSQAGIFLIYTLQSPSDTPHVNDCKMMIGIADGKELVNSKLTIFPTMQ